MHVLVHAALKVCLTQVAACSIVVLVHFQTRKVLLHSALALALLYKNVTFVYVP